MKRRLPFIVIALSLVLAVVACLVTASSVASGNEDAKAAIADRKLKEDDRDAVRADVRQQETYLNDFETSLGVSAMLKRGTVEPPLGIDHHPRSALRQQMPGEGADEARAMALAQHVGLADELVDAARAGRRIGRAGQHLPVPMIEADCAGLVVMPWHQMTDEKSEAPFRPGRPSAHCTTKGALRGPRRLLWLRAAAKTLRALPSAGFPSSSAPPRP